MAFEAETTKEHEETIRQFHILVEKHFRRFHQLGDYANLLQKSSKTLSNVFSKHSSNTPLTIINERVILETKRLLLFSNKTIKEITSDLGFKNASHFSNFVKTHLGMSPSKFKKQKLEEQSGKIT